MSSSQIVPHDLRLRACSTSTADPDAAVTLYHSFVNELEETGTCISAKVVLKLQALSALPSSVSLTDRLKLIFPSLSYTTPSAIKLAKLLPKTILAQICSESSAARDLASFTASVPIKVRQAILRSLLRVHKHQPKFYETIFNVIRDRLVVSEAVIVLRACSSSFVQSHLLENRPNPLFGRSVAQLSLKAPGSGAHISSNLIPGLRLFST